MAFEGINLAQMEINIGARGGTSQAVLVVERTSFLKKG